MDQSAAADDFLLEYRGNLSGVQEINLSVQGLFKFKAARTQDQILLLFRLFMRQEQGDINIAVGPLVFRPIGAEKVNTLDRGIVESTVLMRRGSIVSSMIHNLTCTVVNCDMKVLSYLQLTAPSQAANPAKVSLFVGNELRGKQGSTNLDRKSIFARFLIY